MDKLELPDEIRPTENEYCTLIVLFRKEVYPHINAAIRRLKSEETRPRVRKLPWPSLKKYNAIADALLLDVKEFTAALRIAPEPVVRGFRIAYIPLKDSRPKDGTRSFMVERPQGEERKALLRMLRLLLALNEDASPAYAPITSSWPPLFVRVKSEVEAVALRLDLKPLPQRAPPL